MGFYKTEHCFFTGKKVLRNDEIDGTYLDGYYYAISIGGKVREIRLTWQDKEELENGLWIKEKGQTFIEILENKDLWDFFKVGKNLPQIKQFFELNKN